MSTSTAKPSGRFCTPIAVRACGPRSPKTATNRSEAPSTTCGISVKSAVHVDVAAYLDDLPDRAEPAGGVLDLGEQVEPAAAGGEVGLVAGHRLADPAGVAVRTLTGEEQQVPGADPAHDSCPPWRATAGAAAPARPGVRTRRSSSAAPRGVVKMRRPAGHRRQPQRRGDPVHRAGRVADVEQLACACRSPQHRPGSPRDRRRTGSAAGPRRAPGRGGPERGRVGLEHPEHRGLQDGVERASAPGTGSATRGRTSGTCRW